MPCAMKFRFDSRMPFGTPVVPPEKRIAAASSVAPGARAASGCALPVQLAPPAHARIRAAPERIRRPFVSQKPRRFSGGRSSPRRDSRMVSQRPLRMELRERAVEGVECERHARAADVEVVLDLRRRRQRMDQRRQHAQLVRGVERDHAGRRGRHRDQQPVSGGEAERGQSRGRPVDRRPAARDRSSARRRNRSRWPRARARRWRRRHRTA